MDLRKISKRRKAYIIVFLAIVGIMGWAFITASVITHNFNRSQIVGKEDRQELNISGIIITETKDKVKFWEIYGETGTYNSENKVALLNNCIGNFYKDNVVSMSFESSRGTYNEVKQQIILYDNTHIVIKDGTSLFADKLVWSGSDKDIVATGNIKINRNNELISTAEKVIISPDYAKFKIVGNSVSKLYDLKEKKTK